jgi:hypothetical protein
MRSAVVVAYFDSDGNISARRLSYASIAMVVHHDKLLALGVGPLKKRRDVSGRAGVIYADVEKLDSFGGKGSNDPALMPWNIGHLCAGGDLSETAVQRVRQGDAAGDLRRAHHLGLPGKRKSVPGNVAASDGLFHPPPLTGGRLLQILVQQPRAGRPNIAFRARLSALLGNIDRLREIFLEIAGNHCGLGVYEAGVEVALESYQHTFDRGIRGGLSHSR